MDNPEDFSKVQVGWDSDQEASADQPKKEEPSGGGWNIQGILLVLIILLLLLNWFWPDEKKVNKRENEYAGRSVPRNEIYYDRRTGNLQKYGMNYTPSERMEDGDTAEVRARVFRRGYGVDAGEPYIGYLEMPAPGYSEPQYKAARQNYGDDWGKGIHVRSPDSEGDGGGEDVGWVPADSPEGRKIIRDAYGAEEKCQQGRAFFSR